MSCYDAWVRLLACLAVATGCSQVFGLEAPARGDAAAPDDAADDAPTPDAGSPRSLIDIIGPDRSMGLLVALDAGDAASYDGSAQLWRNLAPLPIPVHFTLGASMAAGTDDPTFHGVAGGRTAEEYFSFDGNDLFRETMAGWGDDNFHRDGLRVTMLAVVWVTPSPPGPLLFANCRCNDVNLATPGFVFLRSSQPGTQSIYIEDEAGASEITSTTATVPTNAWSFMSFSAAANTETEVRHRLNTTVELDQNEPHPYGIGAADGAATIGAMSNGASSAAEGTRIAMLAIWARDLTVAELGGIYDAIRAERFPTLP